MGWINDLSGGDQLTRKSIRSKGSHPPAAGLNAVESGANSVLLG